MPLPEPLLAVPAGRPPEAPRGLGKISTEFDLEDRRPRSDKNGAIWKAAFMIPQHSPLLFSLNVYFL